MCGTSEKIRKGRTHRQIINKCADEFVATLVGIQHKNTKLV
jgi:hypothetical protein